MHPLVSADVLPLPAAICLKVLQQVLQFREFKLLHCAVREPIAGERVVDRRGDTGKIYGSRPKAWNFGVGNGNENFAMLPRCRPEGAKRILDVDVNDVF